MKGSLKKRVFALPKGEKGLLERWANRQKVKKAEWKEEGDFPLYGSVSHGTLRPQDLIPAFLDTLKIVYPQAYEQISVNHAGPPDYVQDEGDDSEWWSSEDAGFFLESLFDTLNESAPEGYYFGAHPGDGSDFGFWRIEEEME